MAKCLITGVGGFVATHLARYLLGQGQIVIGTYRWMEDLSRLSDIRDRVEMVPLDILDQGGCLRCISTHRPDYIFHLAAQSYVRDSFDYPVATVMTNTIGTMNLLEAVRMLKEGDGYDPVFHCCSSSEVYGHVEPAELPIKETQPLRPQNPYAVGKVGADMAAYVYWQSFRVKTIRTRMFTHTGPSRTMQSAESSFAEQIARIEKGVQDSVVQVGNLKSVRTVADVRDAVRAYWMLVLMCRPGEVYNIGGNRTLSVSDMLDYLLSLSPLKSKIKVRVDPMRLRPSDVTLQIPDCTKFKSETGWEPEIPLETTLRELLEYWRRHYGI